MILARNNQLLKPNLDTKLQVNDYQLISHIPSVELIFNHILSLRGKWRVPVNLISLFQGEWLLYSSELGAFGVSVLPHNPLKDKVSNLSPQAEPVQTREGRERGHIKYKFGRLYFLLAVSTIAGCCHHASVMLFGVTLCHSIVQELDPWYRVPVVLLIADSACFDPFPLYLTMFNLVCGKSREFYLQGLM